MAAKRTPSIFTRSILLVFDTQDDLETWVSWYDNTGEQDAGYTVDVRQSNPSHETTKTLVLKTLFDRCPNCKSPHLLDLTDNQEHIQKRIDFFAKGRNLKKQFLCEDCGHSFDMDEEGV